MMISLVVVTTFAFARCGELSGKIILNTCFSRVNSEIGTKWQHKTSQAFGTLPTV